MDGQGPSHSDGVDTGVGETFYQLSCWFCWYIGLPYVRSFGIPDDISPNLSNANVSVRKPETLFPPAKQDRFDRGHRKTDARGMHFFGRFFLCGSFYRGGAAPERNGRSRLLFFRPCWSFVDGSELNCPFTFLERYKSSSYSA